jgi:hypothetical protein
MGKLLIILIVFCSLTFASDVGINVTTSRPLSTTGGTIKTALGAGIVRSDSLGNLTVNSVSSNETTYSASTPTSWAVPRPTTVKNAIDRLADVISAHLGIAIP